MNRPRTGRRSILDDNQKEAITQAAIEEPFTTATIIRDQLELPCSTDTVIRVLHRNGIHSRIPARKPDLSEAQANQRLRFAQQHVDWDWETVIFSDEKVFCSSEDFRKTLWRANNTRYDRRHIQPIKRSGRISCGYWGWMSSAGPGELVRISPHFTSAEYVSILEDVMLPTARAIYPDNNIVFIQDNSPVHTARIVREWFEEHPDIQTVRWPTKSPDLNPIEHLWAAAVRNWGDERNIRTADDLHRNVMSVWEQLRRTTICENIVSSMPRRLQECIDNNGFYIRY